MVKRAALILAGGKARRFQTIDKTWQDKALASLNSKPFLVHIIENVLKYVDEVIIVVNEERRKDCYNQVLSKNNIENVKIITDVKIDNLSGPIVAILSGLLYSTADFCLTIPSDMPLFSGEVADYLFNKLDDSNIAVPMWPNGRLETLVMAIKREPTIKITNALCKLGRSRPDDIIRGSLKVLFASPIDEIKALDPELKSFVNINSQEDLFRLLPRPEQGPTMHNLRLNLGTVPAEQLDLLLEASLKQNNSDYSKATEIYFACAANFEKEQSFFWAALSRENEAKTYHSMLRLQNKQDILFKDAFLKAAQNYEAEANAYQQHNCYILAERAKADKLWCESQTKR